MRHVFRHVLVLTVAIALVVSAAAWRQCTGLQLTALATASIEHSHGPMQHAQAAGHGEHDHQGMHHQHADDSTPPATSAADDHGCLKCCAMCTVATTLPPAATAAVTFAASSRMFFRDHGAWFGNTVAVDPGIPKRIV